MVRKSGLKTTGVRKALLIANLGTIKTPMKREATTTTVEKPIGGAKNGGKRTLIKTTPAQPKPAKKSSMTPACKLRSSIVPGTILILVAGRYRGKRVVFLKQLNSGLLLVTGPYKINGVPFTRISQAFVIATSTRINVSDLSIPDEINDETFKSAKSSKKASFIPENMDVDESPAAKICPERRSAQKSIDFALTAVIKKTPMLVSYLRSLFSLNKGEAPHSMCF